MQPCQKILETGVAGCRFLFSSSDVIPELSRFGIITRSRLAVHLRSNGEFRDTQYIRVAGERTIECQQGTLLHYYSYAVSLGPASLRLTCYPPLRSPSRHVRMIPCQNDHTRVRIDDRDGQIGVVFGIWDGRTSRFTSELCSKPGDNKPP